MTTRSEAYRTVYNESDYQDVKLNEAEAASLRKLSDDETAVRQYIATVQQQGQDRLSQLQERGRDTWGALAEKHGLDLKKVDYTLNDKGDTLIPARVRLV